jgi:hypothetical protein
LETAGYREAEDHEKAANVCTRQDLEAAHEDGTDQQRPCQGTFGFISFDDYVTWNVTIQVPEGYYATSPQTRQFMTGGEDIPLLDFGIAPLGMTPTPIAEPEPVEEVAEPVVNYPYFVQGTGFVYGLVFLDTNEDGMWNIGEAGYGGKYGVRRENDAWV